MKKVLHHLYGDKSEELYNKIRQLNDKYKSKDIKNLLNEKDTMIITYGDSIHDEEKNLLKVLETFLDQYIKDDVSAVHLLPMFPYTSDDGFSVVDYLKINPDFGNWDDIYDMAKKYDLMFDAVISHISKSSDWFKKYQAGDSYISALYSNYWS